MAHLRTILLITSAAVFAQDTPPKFEIASLKAGQTGPQRTSINPASLTMESTRLRRVIAEAYEVQDFQITGPAWLDDVFVNINAKASAPVKASEMRQMLQALLAERMKLVVHRDKKEMTTYVLTVGKNGHKLKQVETAGSPSFSTGKLTLTGSGATIAQLTQFLSAQLREPVVDQTNLPGLYNYFVDINPYFNEEMRRGGDGPPPEGASIVATALQAQLGLKLESKKAPVEMIVVDSVEKTPIEN